MAKSIKFETWLISQLRMASYKYLPRNLALKEARVKRGRYKCAMCGDYYNTKDIQLDHVLPVVDPSTGHVRLPDGNIDWNVYIARLFVPQAGWQVLCKDCHNLKTQSENNQRRENNENTKR